MSRDELVRMLDAGDLYGVFVRIGRMWLAKDHPECISAATIVDLGRRHPVLQVPIIPASGAAAEPFPVQTYGPAPSQSA